MNTQADVLPVSLLNDTGRAQLLLVCEHASNFIPARFENLQLSADVLHSHVALDIGAHDLAQTISRLLDAPLISTTVSRLVYDCNRPFGAGGAIPEKSELFPIPGNQNLSDFDLRDRFEKYYLPFEAAISGRLAAFAAPPLLVTIHSFTPVYHGETRDVDIGIVCDRDCRLADQMVRLAQDQTRLCVEANRPYGPEDGVTHTLGLHGNNNGLLNAMIEVKNDLLGTVEMCREVTSTLATLISRSAAHFGYTIPLRSDRAPIF
ncbi:MAG: N-formylglutamate amidohydrolase [Proteobacteria bacterium]|nr:N-formylglutamate amidohydrolase [Pseudomonadota bacterium]